jgi:hypothetical protein
MVHVAVITGAAAASILTPPAPGASQAAPKTIPTAAPVVRLKGRQPRSASWLPEFDLLPLPRLPEGAIVVRLPRIWGMPVLSTDNAHEIRTARP